MQHSILTTCGIRNGAEVFETQAGFAIVDRTGNPDASCMLLIAFCGHQQFARLAGSSLITEDGEAIEGEALEDVEVMGRVTFFINSVMQDDRVV